MKVLHVEGGRNLYGGALQVLYLLKGLQARGIENVLACPRGSELSRAAAGFAEVCGMRMGGDLDLPMIARIYRLIRSAQPDLIHLHSRIGADVLGAIAAGLAGVPVVHSRRQDNPEMPWLARAKYRLHDRVIAISEEVARVKLSEGLPPHKLRCVRDAVDAGAFQEPCDYAKFRAAFGLPEDSLVIGVVAQLIARKGHRYLLEAMPALIERFPTLHALFFGKGPLEPELRQQSQRLGITERIYFAGFRGDLPQVLPCLNVLVHPALREGLGVSLLQAASAGVPIVAFRAGGVPEAVRDGLNGLLVPPKDVEALRQAIGRVIGDPELARRLGAAGREVAEREFSIDAMVEGNLQVYQELLAQRRV